MGNNYAGQEKAIEELNALSNEAKAFLNHHIGNSLSVIIGAIKVGELELAEEAAWHIVDDMKTAGIRNV
mgnify:CR=1 FL=1